MAKRKGSQSPSSASFKQKQKKSTEKSGNSKIEKGEAFIVDPASHERSAKQGTPQRFDPADLIYIYENHSIIYALVNKIANRVATEGFHFVDTNDEAVENQESEKIKKIFSSTQNNVNIEEVFQNVVRDLLIVGDAYLEFVKANARVMRIERVSPKFMRKKIDANGNVLSYIQVINGREVQTWAPDEMYHLSLHNSDLYGVSPVMATMREINTDLLAVTFNAKFFENDATPMSVFTLKEDFISNDPKQNESIKKQLLDSYQGAHKHGKPMINSVIDDVKTVDRDLDKLQFLETRDKFIEKACAAFDMSKSMIGITDSANEATASQTMQREFYETAIRPKEKMVKEFLNRIIQDLGFAIKLKLNERNFVNREEKINQVMDQRDRGLLTTNEAREILELPQIEEEWAEELVVKTNQGYVSAVPGENQAFTEEQQKAVKGIAKLFKK